MNAARKPMKRAVNTKMEAQYKYVLVRVLAIITLPLVISGHDLCLSWAPPIHNKTTTMTNEITIELVQCRCDTCLSVVIKRNQWKREKRRLRKWTFDFVTRRTDRRHHRSIWMFANRLVWLFRKRNKIKYSCVIIIRMGTLRDSFPDSSKSRTHVLCFVCLTTWRWMEHSVCLVGARAYACVTILAASTIESLKGRATIKGVRIKACSLFSTTGNTMRALYTRVDTLELIHESC